MPDLIFGVSETYVNRAKVRGTKCKEFITVYIGSDFEKIKYENNNDFKTIEKGKNDIWITYVGTLSYSYDIDTAIKAFSELKDFKNLKFIILGSGPDEERLVIIQKN
jgi:glycosyltransferase involved in cell wall biosynthesis